MAGNRWSRAESEDTPVEVLLLDVLATQLTVAPTTGYGPVRVPLLNTVILGQIIKQWLEQNQQAGSLLIISIQLVFQKQSKISTVGSRRRDFLLDLFYFILRAVLN